MLTTLHFSPKRAFAESFSWLISWVCIWTPMRARKQPLTGKDPYLNLYSVPAHVKYLFNAICHAMRLLIHFLLRQILHGCNSFLPWPGAVLYTRTGQHFYPKLFVTVISWKCPIEMICFRFLCNLNPKMWTDLLLSEQQDVSHGKKFNKSKNIVCVSPQEVLLFFFFSAKIFCLDSKWFSLLSR